MFYKLQHVVLQQFSNIVLIDICVQNPYFKTVASVIKKAPASLPVLIWLLANSCFRDQHQPMLYLFARISVIIPFI